MCYDMCSMKGVCSHECPFPKSVCEKRIQLERAILYIIRLGGGFTLREITSVMLYVDVVLSNRYNRVFFSDQWNVKDDAESFFFIPNNLINIFPIRNLSAISIHHDKTRTQYTSSGEVVYSYKQATANDRANDGMCNNIDMCENFLICEELRDVIIAKIREAIEVLKDSGIETLSGVILRELAQSESLTSFKRDDIKNMESRKNTLGKTSASIIGNALSIMVPYTMKTLIMAMRAAMRVDARSTSC